MEKPHKDSHRYILTIPYETDEELDRIIYEDVLGEANRICLDKSDPAQSGGQILRNRTRCL